MHQQINLYQPVFRRQEKVFSAITLLQIGAAVLVLLLIIIGHAHWTLAGMDRTAQSLEQQLNGLNQHMGRLEDGSRTPDTDALDQEIDALLADIDQRNLLLTQFDQLVTRHQSGFATKFKALAEEHVPGLWLESVAADNEQKIELRGITLDAKLVPIYLQQLARRKDLSETAFETLSMTRIDADKPQIRFVLRNFEGDAAWN
jgi:Tfp pilus assembly protein PilN